MTTQPQPFTPAGPDTPQEWVPIQSPPEAYGRDYPKLSDVPSDVLASRLVGSLIMAKGDLVKYKLVFQRFIDMVRAEFENRT